jgi:hypothetical protein
VSAGFLGIAPHYWALAAALLLAFQALSMAIGTFCGALVPLLPPASRAARWARAGAKGGNDVAGALRELRAVEQKLEPVVEAFGAAAGPVGAVEALATTVASGPTPPPAAPPPSPPPAGA